MKRFLLGIAALVFISAASAQTISVQSSYLDNVVALQSGRYYTPMPVIQGTAGAPAKDTLYAIMGSVTGGKVQPFTISALTMLSQGAATGTVNHLMCLYDINSANPYKPDGAALLSAGTVGTVSTGGGAAIESALTSATLITKQQFWIAVTLGNTGTVPNFQGMNLAVASLMGGGASVVEAFGSSAQFIKGYSVARVYDGTCPNPFPNGATSVITAGFPPVMGFKVQ